jgi:hypothetical protein
MKTRNADTANGQRVSRNVQQLLTREYVTLCNCKGSITTSNLLHDTYIV